MVHGDSWSQMWQDIHSRPTWVYTVFLDYWPNFSLWKFLSLSHYVLLMLSRYIGSLRIPANMEWFTIRYLLKVLCMVCWLMHSVNLWELLKGNVFLPEQMAPLTAMTSLLWAPNLTLASLGSMFRIFVLLCRRCIGIWINLVFGYLGAKFPGFFFFPFFSFKRERKTKWRWARLPFTRYREFSCEMHLMCIPCFLYSLRWKSWNP